MFYYFINTNLEHVKKDYSSMAIIKVILFVIVVFLSKRILLISFSFKIDHTKNLVLIVIPW